MKGLHEGRLGKSKSCPERRQSSNSELDKEIKFAATLRSAFSPHSSAHIRRSLRQESSPGTKPRARMIRTDKDATASVLSLPVKGRIAFEQQWA